uniref:GB1/RHD3-type G domain-containing protein n=1 Tax=Meloidogyne enterolobii TaxID=390850 RepID=A0A6V7XQS8_MELEN|nr:unnamed protein product [Meloidogyne enterolobii]
MSVTAPVSIISPVAEEDGETQQSFEIYKDKLESILLDPKIADKQVCVVSVAGAFRTGKSFILNFFLRYLRWKTCASDDESETDWLQTNLINSNEGNNGQLKGFSWRGGDDRETSGILIWPEPFILQDKHGNEIVVILMDTQGIFDCVSTVKSCATIFALSTMISSILIYNVTKTIQEDHLQHLQLFAEYARLAMDEYQETKPFQTLMFLVRDWCFPYEAEYGINGGQRILDKRLETGAKQHKELLQLRLHIKSTFENIKCFLMPHPGLDVATSPDFRGELNTISADFKAQLHALVPHLFDRNNLVVKAINGQQITCRELSVYLNAYFEVFNGTELPEPKTILAATAEANNLAAVASAKAVYSKEMEEVCGGDTPFMSSAELNQHHERCRASALLSFNSAKKMGGPELTSQFREKLEEDIKSANEAFIRVNNSKNLFKSVKTPAVLVSFMVVCYIFQEFFQLLGLFMVASVFSLILTIVIALLVTWTYSRYSGHLRDAQKTIDTFVNFVHGNFILPTFATAMGNATLDLAMGSNSTFTMPSNSTSSTSEEKKKK